MSSSFSIRAYSAVLGLAVGVFILSDGLSIHFLSHTTRPVHFPLAQRTGTERAIERSFTSVDVHGPSFTANANLRVCTSDLFSAKSSGGEEIKIASARQARAILCDPQSNTGVAAVVNLAKNRVEADDRLDAGEIPSASADFEEARNC